MSKVLLVGCDDHWEKMVLQVGVDRGEPGAWRSARRRKDRQALIARLKAEAEKHGAERIVMAYEASGQGYTWHDELVEAGIECYVLAPSKIQRSPKEQKQKDDAKDAKLIYQLVRGHVLAGNELPLVWVPPPQVRDDREVTRGAAGVTQALGQLKVQVRGLLRMHGVEEPEGLKAWTKEFRTWLEGLTECQSLGSGVRFKLASLLRQLQFMEGEVAAYEKAVQALGRQPRYQQEVAALDAVKGVGPTLAVTFMTELGDVQRFGNRKQVGAYLGLTPSAAESGESGERKGHITKQGSGLLRKLLCQATWSRVRRGGYGEAQERGRYERQVARNPKRKKIAVVASMRRLAVSLYHVAAGARGRSGSETRQPELPRPQALGQRGRPFAPVAVGVGPASLRALGAQAEGPGPGVDGRVGPSLEAVRGAGAALRPCATDADGDGATGLRGQPRSGRKRARQQPG